MAEESNFANLRYGVCRHCGCTDDKACVGGCSWTDPEHTVCSNPECIKKEGLEPPKMDDGSGPQHFFVNGIVAQRNNMPYIQLSNERGLIAQLDMAQARQIAMDILQMSARTEADAMIVKFFTKAGLDGGPTAAFMGQFRDFRAELDAESAEPRVG